MSLPAWARRHDPHDVEILRLAVPAFGALVAEPLFLLADSAIVGHLGTRPLAGLGVAGSALATLVSVCVFLAYGTTAAVARSLGAGDLRGALHRGVEGLWLAAGLGAVLAVVGAVVAEPVVRLLGASSAVEPYAVRYLVISLIGVPPMLVVLAATGLLRGLQDTRTPLVVAVVASAVNLGLNALLVLGLGLGITGSALGTVVVQWGSAATYLVVIVPSLRAHEVRLRPTRAGQRATVTVSFHLLLRTITLRAVLLLATAVAARLGDTTIAAHQVAFAVWSLLALGLDAIAIAAQAITGRYLGAGDTATTQRLTARMVAWGVASGAVFALLVLLARPVVVPLFTSSQAVQDELAAALVVVALLQPLAGLVFVLDGVLIGAGDARYLAIAGVVTMATFVPAALAVLWRDGGIVALWLAIGLFMLARAMTLTVRARTPAWLVVGA